MSEWNSLKLDMLNNIRNFVEMYPYLPVEAALIEAVANCLDANATNIAISTFKDQEGKSVLKVEDNGKGMTKDEFEELMLSAGEVARVVGGLRSAVQKRRDAKKP